MPPASMRETPEPFSVSVEHDARLGNAQQAPQRDLAVKTAQIAQICALARLPPSAFATSVVPISDLQHQRAPWQLGPAAPQPDRLL
jgi:hypothetical protein